MLAYSIVHSLDIILLTYNISIRYNIRIVINSEYVESSLQYLANTVIPISVRDSVIFVSQKTRSLLFG